MQVTATEAKNRFGQVCAQAKTAPVIVENEGLQNVGLNLITVIVGAAGNPFPNSGAGGADTDGSELLPTTAQISLPQTVIDLVLGAGAPAGATLLETAPQSGTWTLSAANPADLQSALGFVQAVKNVVTSIKGFFDKIGDIIGLNKTA